ncbi:HypC/HybG/HupF family hydrogenase formation chaperone [Pseudonocardia bannensis]|uniref:HypC/HybG/HupF family hydrogenase formation chaperone n=1 Tax=Pseudonocardia bannensis TaxID=630973 RepID=A0A848DJP0_9PSEU|nr:HypC/HybG/HupF family hydrogenase formation chaperone [Pseudonocardia bannensis]NMH92746.1 HypC/HybG/HupF family hydrogenase formation chaperone [Pseudonocardia bannensis]
MTAPEQCHGPTCITCSDAAVAVTVTRLLDDGLALVDTGAGPGTEEEVSIALVDARVGDVVLVHAGEAIALMAGKVTPEP